MGLDLVLFQADKGGEPDTVRESQRRRFADIGAVDRVIALAEHAKTARYEWEQAKAGAKAAAKAAAVPNIALRKLLKAPEAERDAAAIAALEAQLADLKAAKVAGDERIGELKAEVDRVEAERDAALAGIGNLVHESVPVSETEDKNVTVRTHGDKTPGDGLLHHHEVLHRLHLAELERGAGVAGHRAYFLRGMGVRLNQALITYALDFLAERGYVELQTPFMMRKDAMAKTCQLSSDEDLYHLANDDAYLIATSEQPISAMHQNEWFAEKDVKGKPMCYAGYSTCFRREAGSHGKDVWGIFRVHQFEKVEQFIICAPDESWDMLEKMVETAEAFYQSLGLSYRLVTIVSKELNAAAAKKYDLEAWFPARQDYRELVSASNCTDYQARALGIKYGQRSKEDKSEKFVHMLNGTMCATERTLCCLLENFQDADGFVIPEVLRKYLGGKERIDFVREAPKKSATKAQRKQQNPDAAKQGGKGQKK